MKALSQYFTAFAGGGISALSAHAFCFLTPVFAGAAIAGSTVLLMNAAYIASPVIAAGVSAGVHYYRDKRFCPRAIFTAAAAALSFGLYQFSDHNHDISQIEQWYVSQSAEAQKMIAENADIFGVGLYQYIGDYLCNDDGTFQNLNYQ